MSSTPRAVVAAGFLLLGIPAAWAEDPLSRMRPDEFLAIPMTLKINAGSVPLTLPAYAFLALKKASDGQLRIDVRAAADLADLQGKVGPVVGAIPLPKDNCARQSADNIVAKAFGREIAIDGNVATLKLSGEVEVWGCKDLPIIGRAKTILFQGSFDSDLPFRVEIVDPQTPALRPGNPDVRLRGPLGDFFQTALGWLNVDLNSEVRNRLVGALDPNLLKNALPQELRDLNPVFMPEGSGFFRNSSSLAVALELNMPFDDKTLAAVLTALLTHKG